jgi:TFIIF-interacting CTD phosphatase-like protein
VRPFAASVLKELAAVFEVIIFTASNGCYANVVIDQLDPQRQFVAHRLFRESCVQTSDGVYVKDLRVINRDLAKLVLVDNSAISFAQQVSPLSRSTTASPSSPSTRTRATASCCASRSTSSVWTPTTTSARPTASS